MIGDVVKTERTKKGYTQKDLADRIGVSHAAISKLEKRHAASKQILIAVGRELESDFSLPWLNEHFDKYPLPQKNLTELLTEKIRGIVRDELERDKHVLDKIYSEAKTDTKIPRHKNKKL